VLAGRYQLGPTLGIGGSAAVYQAVDLALNHTVAVKLYRALDMDETQAARAAEEARVLACLDHPSIPPLYDAGVAEGRNYLVTPLIKGLTLAERIRGGPVAATEVHRLGIALTDALCHVHARGIVHRDVKPDNILLAPGGGIRLVDFGIARASGSREVTAKSLVVGTAGYLAPERIRGAAATPSTDVYAVGLTLLEALVGRRTYEGTALQQAMAAIDRPPVIPATLGPRWYTLLSALTDSDPRRRPTMSDAGDVLSGWDPSGDRHPPEQQPCVQPPAPPAPLTQPRQGHRQCPCSKMSTHPASITKPVRAIF
jgi:serine/threonine protein kinase